MTAAPSNGDDLTAADRAAMTLAMEIARQDPARRWQIAAMLNEEPWERVAHFAASYCQRQALKLKAFQCPPVEGQ
jgi:hypothetical protein